MRRHFVSGLPRALLSISQEKSSRVEIRELKISDGDVNENVTSK